MKPVVLSMLYIFIPWLTFSQNDTIKQFDLSARKQGKRILYLDENWKQTDSSNAVFYRYTYYENGTDIYPMGPCGRKGWTMQSVLSDSLNPEKKRLNGEYVWHDKKGNKRSEHVFHHGFYVSCKEYDSSGELEQFFDYSKKYKSEPHTWHVYLYKHNKKEKTFVMRNGYKGWFLYLISGDDF